MDRLTFLTRLVVGGLFLMIIFLFVPWPILGIPYRTILGIPYLGALLLLLIAYPIVGVRYLAREEARERNNDSSNHDHKKQTQAC